MLAADTFVPLATWLAHDPAAPRLAAPPDPWPAAPPDPGIPPCHPERRFAQRTEVEGPPPASPPALPEAERAAPEPPTDPARREALRDLRLFRARLAEALELATAALVRDLAYAVLGRELRLTPADVACIATRILADHPAAEPVAIRHAPGDEPPAGIPAVADPTLAPGDCVVVFAGGDVDARLGVRLATVLEAWS